LTVTTDITDGVLLDISVAYSASLTSFTLGAFAYEWAVAGQPFLGVASDEFPMIRAFTASAKEQFDNQRDPGEQSLSGWWLRSQRDFSGGAGITYLEPADDERTMRRTCRAVTQSAHHRDPKHRGQPDPHLVPLMGLWTRSHNQEVSDPPNPDSG
jgi:hypothetical protein